MSAAVAQLQVRPPPSELVGHENLIAYFGLTKWSKALMKNCPSSLDALLHEAALPLLAGDRLADGSAVNQNPNDSLLACAFQAVPPPLQPRALTDRQRRVLTFNPSTSKASGPLSLASKLEALVASRAALLAEEERQAKRERKRRKREDAARAEADAAAAAAAAASSAAAAAPSTATQVDNKLVLNLSRKRKAEEAADASASGGVAGEQIPDKKKSKKKKADELVV